MDSTQRTDRIVAIATAILLTAGCIVVLYPGVLLSFFLYRLAIVFYFAPGRTPQ